MRLRTLHRRNRKSRITPKEFEALKFCNRFAPNFYVKHSRITALVYCFQVYKANFPAMSKWDYERAIKRGYASYYAGDLFYELKNRLLAKFGKPVGFQLQTWDDDHWDNEGFHEFKQHKHILQIVRIKTFEFHQPTGHFHFYSDDDYSSYIKKSVGFEDFEKLCSNKILCGKKEVKLDGDELKAITTEFHIKLRYLLKQFRPLLMQPFVRPRVETEVIRNNYMENWFQEQAALKNQHPELDFGI